MVFSSISFLCLFLPAFLLAERLIPGVRGKNILLTAASLLFYAYGEPIFVFVLIAAVFLHWLAGVYVRGKDRYPKSLLAALLTVDVALLFCFKYAGFAAACVNGLFGISLPAPQIRLPVGISFFTFQIMSYAVDTYRDRRLIQPRFGDLLLYIAFFPQLIAGPIVRYTDIALQLSRRAETEAETAAGLRRFIFGLAKKVLLANTLATVVDRGYALDTVDTPTAWILFFAYGLQIYYDFSGYSDMAIGLGRIFGFRFPENFRYPYAACSVTDFWRRWHMSLTAWFREYIYIPLGGNRRGTARTLLHILIVFLLTGIWHGASYTYIVWGLYFAAFMIAERAGVLPVGKLRVSLPGRVYTVFVVFAGFVLFRADSLSQALDIWKACFSFAFAAKTSIVEMLPLMTPFFWFVFAVAAVLCFPAPEGLRVRRGNNRCVSVASYFVAVVLLVVCVFSLATDSYNPFIYFHF